MFPVEQVNIAEIIPQRPPFVMVDRLTYFDEVKTSTAFDVTADNMFVQDGLLCEPGIIENIAQTCAARMGYINTYIVPDTVKLGFIGAIKNLVINELPRTGDELRTTIEVTGELFGITMVNANVEAGGRLIASCEMKISLTDIVSQ